MRKFIYATITINSFMEFRKSIEVFIIVLIFAFIFTHSVKALCVEDLRKLIHVTLYINSSVKFYSDGVYFVLKNVGNHPHKVKVIDICPSTNKTMDITNTNTCHYVCKGCGHGYYPEDVCREPVILEPGRKISFVPPLLPLRKEHILKIYVDGVLAKEIRYEGIFVNCEDEGKYTQETVFSETKACPSGVCNITIEKRPVFTQLLSGIFRKIYEWIKALL